jgi:predicted helicase
MITNHSYLDNPTFRGMRQSLMKTFDEIYILDLHGNSLKKETTPEGGKDENVFDIRQGVAIALFIKNKEKKEAAVYHTSLYGLREEKYDWLDENEFKVENYTDLKPISPWHFFIPRDVSKIQKYLKWKKINEIFPVNVTGIVTARDSLAIDFNKNTLRNKIQMFRNPNLPDDIIKDSLKISENYQWKIPEQRKKFREVKDWENYFNKILYRPFDKRHIYYQDNIVFRRRFEVMKNILEENIGLLTCRQISSNSWRHALISKNLVDDSLISNKTKERTYLYPLYIYPDKQKKNLFNHHITEKEPNIPPQIFNKLEECYNRIPIPEEILYYIYGTFYSNIYRETYAEFLKIDFPRVPFTADENLFCEMGNLGKQLADLHLLKSPLLDIPVARYQGSGDNDRIEKIDYQENQQRIYINNEKYFEGITSEVWNYHIGGYQVLPKYLKDRKGKIMEDAPHYCKVVTALQKTIELQKQIDNLYPEIEKNLIVF